MLRRSASLALRDALALPDALISASSRCCRTPGVAAIVHDEPPPPSLPPPRPSPPMEMLARDDFQRLRGVAVPMAAVPAPAAGRADAGP